MSIFDKVQNAISNNDAQAFLNNLADDFEFVRHQTGTSMNKIEMAAMIPEMMKNDVFKYESHKLLYENDDIMVEHYVMDFPDGTREAVIGVNTLSDGKITRLETGATLIKS